MIYVIMKKVHSPIYLTEAKVHGYCDNLIDTKKIVAQLNAKAMKNYYWYSKAKLLNAVEGV